MQRMLIASSFYHRRSATTGCQRKRWYNDFRQLPGARRKRQLLITALWGDELPMLISNLFRRVRESFQSRVFVLLTFLILVTSVAFTALYLRNERISQSERLVAEGELLARLLAYNSRLAVFSEPESMLREVADGVLQHGDVLAAVDI